MIFDEFKYGSKYASKQNATTRRAMANKSKNSNKERSEADTLQLLLTRIEKVLEIDAREVQFYLNKLVDTNDDNIDSGIRELFVLLKLQYAEECPDYKKMDNEIYLVNEERKHQKQQLILKCQFEVDRTKKVLLDETIDWVIQHIKLYKIIKNNNGNYTESYLYNNYQKEIVLNLFHYGYIKKSFFSKRVYICNLDKFRKKNNNSFACPFTNIFEWQTNDCIKSCFLNYRDALYYLDHISNYSRYGIGISQDDKFVISTIELYIIEEISKILIDEGLSQ